MLVIVFGGIEALWTLPLVVDKYLVFTKKKRILSVIINLCALKQKMVRINLNVFIQRIRKQLR
jgi:hypothetical protein